MTHDQLVILMGALTYFIIGAAIFSVRGAIKKTDASPKGLLNFAMKKAERNVEYEVLFSNYPVLVVFAIAFAWVTSTLFWPCYILKWAFQGLRSRSS